MDRRHHSFVTVVINLILLINALVILAQECFKDLGSKKFPPLSSKIIGGTNETIPCVDDFITLILGSSEKENYSTIGGGTIIDKHWILTARHNLIFKNYTYKPFHDIHPYLTITTDRIKLAKFYTPLTVSATFCHRFVIKRDNISEPWKSINGDIGLIYVDEEIPIIPSQSSWRSYPKTIPVNSTYVVEEGLNLWVTGWGVTNYTDRENQTCSIQLRKNLIQARSNRYCLDRTRWPRVQEMCEFIFFAGNKYNNTCYGDSGGPAYIFPSNSNQSYEPGISSAGNCRYANIFQKVSYYKTWIDKIKIALPGKYRCDFLFPDDSRSPKEKAVKKKK